ncbi:hypothetical protein Leryth_022727 [Lithospermum erythrorhizon]|nr:hypothetical protein Leryth_022727 [Lithospermum erythrorhizon]
MFGASIVQDRDLNEYSPSKSRTSKHLPCSHKLCEQGPNCGSPSDNCPYTVAYVSDNTSSKGFLFEDLLHLTVVGGHANQTAVQASIILGCGTKQSGDYLDDSAPDGLIGLGPGDMSIPSLLAKSGLIPHSFSLCFDKSYSGSISFGDQGHLAQRSTPFIALNGEYSWYIVEVDGYCFGGSCLKESGFEALVDSGSSFTYLPDEIYSRVVSEFDQQVDTSRFTIQDFPYCYKANSDKIPRFPTMKLMLSSNQSFIIENPTFRIVGEEGVSADCLGIHHTSDDVGIIGQNFMMGYRLVFDMENKRLAWSHSNCQDIGGTKLHPSPPPSNRTASQLPTSQQQLPGGHAVAPAVAGRAPTKPSMGSPLLIRSRCRRILLLLQTIVLLSYAI